jgi:DNA-binding NarL/FixJ family response regulator
MRVLLADTHPKVRWALHTFIKEEPGLTIVGEAKGADTLLSQALTLQPDLILLEWELTGWPVDKLLAALRALDLPVRVIVLSWRPESEQDALDAGAAGFVNKAGGPEQLVAALRRLKRIQDHISPTDRAESAILSGG